SLCSDERHETGEIVTNDYAASCVVMHRHPWSQGLSMNRAVAIGSVRYDEGGQGMGAVSFKDVTLRYAGTGRRRRRRAARGGAEVAGTAAESAGATGTGAQSASAAE